MASSSSIKKRDNRIFLSYLQVLEHWLNSRVITITQEHKWNKKGYAFFVFCRDNSLELSEAKPVCLYQNAWHSLGHDLTMGQPYISLPALEVHQSDAHSDPEPIESPTIGDPPTPLPYDRDSSSEEKNDSNNKGKQQVSHSASEADNDQTIIRNTSI
jgi:hypothetical protein